MNTTKQAIQNAFIALYGRMPMDRITVKRLCQEAAVARTTFYEYYDHLGELKAEIEDGCIGDIVEMARQDEKLVDFFEQTLQYVQAHRTINEAFLIRQHNEAYIKKWKQAIRAHFARYFPSEKGAVSHELALEVIASAVIGAYTYWMEHPDAVDIPALSRVSAGMLEAAIRML